MTISRPLWASQRGGTQLAVKLSFPTDADGNGVLTDDEVGANIVARVGLPKVAKVGDVITVTDGTTPADITLTQTDLDAGYVESTFSFPESNLFSGSAWITHTADPIPGEIGVMLSPEITSGSYDETSGEIVLDLTDDSTGDPDYREVYRDTATMDPVNLPAPHATNLPASQTQFREAVDEDGTTYYYRAANVKGSKKKVSGEVSVFAGDPFESVQIGDEIGGGYYAGIDTVDGTDYHIISGKEDSRLVRVAWKTTQTTTSNTTSATDGLANTNAMVAAGIADHPAAQHCVNYEGGGFTDWHLGARSQLELIYNNLAGQTALFTKIGSSSDYLWTSTEQSFDNAWIKRTDGFETGTPKDVAGNDTIERIALPIRRIPV